MEHNVGAGLAPPENAVEAGLPDATLFKELLKQIKIRRINTIDLLMLLR